MKSSFSDSGLDIVIAAIETLQQGEQLLATMSDEAYTQKLPLAFNASIGGHYRHCLDHFRAVLDSAVAGELNYDHRERGTLIETDRFAALNATRELLEGFECLEAGCLPLPLKITCKSCYASDDSQTSSSTLGREIMYAVAHAVHHYAVIAIMAGMMGHGLRGGFGVAPATLKHHAKVAS